MSQIQTAMLQFITEKKFIPRDAEGLRGAFGHMYREEDLFHNHDPEGKTIYRMPLIQYRVIEGTLSVLAYNEGIPVLADKFLQVKNFRLKGREVKDFEVHFVTGKKIFLVDDGEYGYKLISPWLGVNQRNYAAYQNGELDLDRVLQNNLLSNFKGLGLRVDKRITVKGSFSPKDVNVKNLAMTGFTGEFICNVKIPEYMCFGKRRAVGFGCVVGGAK